MKVLQTMIGLLLLFLFDLAVLNTFPLRQYVVPHLEEAIKSFIVRFDVIAVILIPAFIGIVLRSCFVSWAWWWQTPLVVAIFLWVHYIYSSLARIIGWDGFSHRELSEPFYPYVKYLFLGVLLIATMIVGNLIGGRVRKKKVPPRGYE